MNPRASFSLATILILGCTTQQGAELNKHWEYKHVWVDPADDPFEHVVNEHGRHGWEIIKITASNACWLKRRAGTGDQWEYKQVILDSTDPLPLQESMNADARKGWEVIDITSANAYRAKRWIPR